MRPRMYVGVHAESDARRFFQLRRALHVDFENSCRKRQVDLGGRLAYAGEHDTRRGIFANVNHALQLAAAHHVEGAAHRGQQPQHRQVRVRLHRVTNRMGLLFKRPLKGRHAGAYCRCRVNIERRAKALRQPLHGHLIAAESEAGMAASVGKGRGTLLQGVFANGHFFFISLIFKSAAVWPSNASIPDSIIAISARCAITAARWV